MTIVCEVAAMLSREGWVKVRVCVGAKWFDDVTTAYDCLGLCLSRIAVRRKYTECILLFMNNNNWWLHIQVCGHDDDDLVLNAYLNVCTQSQRTRDAGMASFGVGATSLRRFGVEVASLLCRLPVGIDGICPQRNWKLITVITMIDVLPTPTRAKVTSTFCPKDSDVEMSLTHRCLSETGDTLCSMLLKFYALCENNKSASLR